MGFVGLPDWVWKMGEWWGVKRRREQFLPQHFKKTCFFIQKVLAMQAQYLCITVVR